MQFKVFEAGIEVNGNTVLAIVKGFGLVKRLAKTHLRDAGLPEEIIASDWYSQQAWLRAFETIAAMHGDDILYRIGLVIPENAVFPDWIKTVDDAIKSIDVAYHMNHRKDGVVMFDAENGSMTEGIGHYGYKRIKGENIIISECNNPYPCSFDRGIITCMAARFQPGANIIHDDSKPCRKNGSEFCTYLITW